MIDISIMKKKVCMLLTNCFEPDPRVYREAKSLIDNGYDVIVYGWDRDKKKKEFEIIDGIKIRRIYVRSTHSIGKGQIIFLLFFWLKCAWNLLWFHYDIIHCHDFDTLPLGFLLGKLRGKKIIYDAHESYVDMLEANLNPLLKKIIYTFENFLINKVDIFITVGDILKENLESRGAKKGYVVGNWKKPEDFQIPNHIIKLEKSKLDIPQSAIVITFIANLGYERKLEPLVNALDGCDYFFLLVGGNGPMVPWLLERVKKQVNIKYLGIVKPENVPLYTAMADIVYYGFDKHNPNARFSAPNKLFEALAAGKVILSGNFGEIGKIIKKENCGLILEEYTTSSIKKSLNSLLSSTFITKLQANSLRAGKEKFHWITAEKNLLQLYSEICN